MSTLKAIRRTVFARASNACEACGQWVTEETGHLDHARGRGRAESVESCWALCVPCDLAKTMNEPTSAHWLAKFARHCERHGYAREAELARARLAFVETRKGLAP